MTAAFNVKLHHRLHTGLIAILLPIITPTFTALAAPPVTLTEQNDVFVLDNGLVRAEVEKRDGTLYSLEYQGQELLTKNGGYWSSVGRGNGNRPPGHLAEVVTNTPDRVEVVCRLGNVAGATNISLDSDFHYSLARGDSQIYVSAIFHHTAGHPGYGTGESRYCLKLNPTVFDFLSIDADRQRLMPSGFDWDHGTQMNVKEARRLTTGIHKGEVEHKYDYSARFTDIPAYGWLGTKAKIGLWLINPSLEYIGGGPTKVELTGHLDVNPGGTPTLLNMWQGSHYGGTSLAIGPDEDWTKMVGPFALYCNTASTPTALWHDALVQATNDMRRWPFDWVQNPNYPPAAGRGTLTGQLILRDRFAPEATMSNVWVGVSAPDYRPPALRPGGGRGTNSVTGGYTNWVNKSAFPPFVEWQRDTKFYQFWAQADANGKFEIPHIRPGHYTLHAFGDGVIGEYTQTNITVNAGETQTLGQLVWQPLRFGHTLWQIGVPDRTAREFRHGDHFWQWGLYYQYPKDFPKDVDFIVGQSDWHRDWNYAQPPRILSTDQPVVGEDEESGNPAPVANHRGTLEDATWKIEFNLTNAPTGQATLRLAFAGARDGCEVEVKINGRSIGTTGLLPATGVMHRDGIQGYWFERDLTFNADRLLPGTNVIKLISYADNWTQGVMYDCVRLELGE